MSFMGMFITSVVAQRIVARGVAKRAWRGDSESLMVIVFNTLMVISSVAFVVTSARIDVFKPVMMWTRSGSTLVDAFLFAHGIKGICQGLEIVSAVHKISCDTKIWCIFSTFLASIGETLLIGAYETMCNRSE